MAIPVTMPCKSTDRLNSSSPSDREEELLAFLESLLVSETPPEIPPSFSADEKLIAVFDYLMMLRKTLANFAEGDFSPFISHRGYLAECVKRLQANLQHLIRCADRLSDDGFDHCAEYMKNFSSFDTMLQRFRNTLEELRNHQEKLTIANEELFVSKERWRLALACTQDGICDIDLRTGKAFFSQRLWSILRRPRKDKEINFNPVAWGKFIHTNDTCHWFERIESLESEKPHKQGENDYLELRVRGGDGKYRWLGCRYILLSDETGRPYRCVGSCEDIQEQREHENDIRMKATHDSLTGLPNRHLYNDRIAQQIATAKRTRIALSMIVWDLDAFKEINDNYGHLVGDEVLKRVANIMKSSIRETDTIARFGGDEFVMLLSSPKGSEEQTALQAVERIFGALRQEIRVGGISIHIGASCGISFYPKHASKPEKLLELADKALYIAKRTGKNRFAVWAPNKIGR